MTWRWVPMLCALCSLFVVQGRARAEGAHRFVLWPADGVGAEALVAARARLEAMGQVLELPPAAPAGPSAEALRLEAESSAVVERAREAYYEARFGDAVELLTEHVDADGPALASAGAMEALRLCLLWLGAALAKVDRADDAVERFALAVALGLEEIDRTMFPPEVTAAFDRAREGAASRPSTPAHVEVTPESATLELDGSPVEAAPSALARGLHVLVARRLGYVTAARLVAVGEAPVAVAVTLEPAAPEVELRQVAELRRDGRLDPHDREHLALVASALGATHVAVVAPSTGDAIALVGPDGAAAPWPEPVGLPSRLDDGAEATPERAPGDGGQVATPVWRRWWFWVAIVGSAAAVATGVGLGVTYGARPDTFRIVAEPPR